MPEGNVFCDRERGIGLRGSTLGPGPFVGAVSGNGGVFIGIPIGIECATVGWRIIRNGFDGRGGRGGASIVDVFSLGSFCVNGEL